MTSKLFAGFAVIAFLIITSCNQSVKNDKPLMTIENNVRAYFEMGDSVDLNISIADTIFYDELVGMQENVNKNYNLVQTDIDTLNYMIENWQNQLFNLTDNEESDVDIKQAKIMMLSYELNQADAELAQLTYTNSRRIFKNLKRSTNNSISGYEISAAYTLGEENNTLTLLLDAEYRVVD
jgi:hypothetical protein